MNYSKQRAEIIKVLKGTTCHPTAEWVYAEVKKAIPNISLGTVYRNLKQLEQSGDILRINGTFEKERFDGNPLLHAHFVCDICGEVFDLQIPNALSKDILTLSPEATGFTLNYNGVCASCKNAGVINKNKIQED